MLLPIRTASSSSPILWPSYEMVCSACYQIPCLLCFVSGLHILLLWCICWLLSGNTESQYVQNICNLRTGCSFPTLSWLFLCTAMLASALILMFFACFHSFPSWIFHAFLFLPFALLLCLLCHPRFSFSSIFFEEVTRSLQGKSRNLSFNEFCLEWGVWLQASDASSLGFSVLFYKMREWMRRVLVFFFHRTAHFFHATQLCSSM